MKTFKDQLAAHLANNKKATKTERAMFWYGAICTLAQLGRIDEALDLADRLGVSIPGMIPK